jgi:probable rRNA maturation factor
VSVAVDVAAEGVRVPLAAARVAELARGVLRAERVRAAMLSIAFVTDREIARLNRAHLGHRGPTDVISFGFAPAGSGGPVVGDVYIAPGVARANARAHGAGVREELARLVVHGTLHVLGHDHPEDEDRVGSAMWRRQEALLARLFTSPPT